MELKRFKITYLFERLKNFALKIISEVHDSNCPVRKLEPDSIFFQIFGFNLTIPRSLLRGFRFPPLPAGEGGGEGAKWGATFDTAQQAGRRFIFFKRLMNFCKLPIFQKLTFMDLIPFYHMSKSAFWKFASNNSALESNRDLILTIKRIKMRRLMLL